MPNNPKLNEFLHSQIDTKDAQKSTGRYGIVMSYDRKNNTATVLMSSIDSDIPSQFLTDVHCPVVMGVQTTAPEPGRPCWVTFKTDNQQFPVISHYFNYNFQKFDHDRHYNADIGLPNFIHHI